MKKKISLILAICMTVGMLAGCVGGKKANSNEKVTLKYVLPGPGMQADSEMVWAKLNEKLKTYPGLENVSVDIRVIPTADYSQKFILWQTSGEQMDVVQTYTLDYAKEARNGTFLPLDKYIEKSEGLKEALPEFMWRYSLVDGTKYYIPNYQVLTGVDWSFATPKSSADKYWDAKKAQEVMVGEKTFTDKCWDVLEEYLGKLSAAGEIGLGYQPLDSLTFTLEKGFVSAASRFFYREDDPEHKLMYMDEIPERINSFKRLSDFYKKGYIRSDISSATGSDADFGKNGGYMLWHEGTHAEKLLEESTTEKINAKRGMEITTVMTKDYDCIPMNNAAGGTAVSASSKNPDQAFRFIEVINTLEGKDAYNLLALGIEGTHYKKLDEETIETTYIAQAGSTAPYGLWVWNTGNTKYAYKLISENVDRSLIDVINTSESAKVSPLTGFVPDTSSIETELAQINAVFEEFKDLNKGNLADVDKSYNEYIQKVKKAGMEKVKAELQKQVDEFLKK